MLSRQVTVRILGAPSACAAGVTDGWRDAAMMVSAQLIHRFGDQLVVEYVDLFGPEMQGFPEVLEQVSEEGLALPLVYIDDRLFSSGGKINGPAIRQHIEALA